MSDNDKQYRKTQQITSIRPSIYPALTELAGKHDIKIVDILTYLIAYVYVLPEEEREHIISKGSGIAVMFDLGAKFQLDMSEDDFKDAVLEVMSDAPEPE